MKDTLEQLREELHTVLDGGDKDQILIVSQRLDMEILKFLRSKTEVNA
jgi:hypothetical protein